MVCDSAASRHLHAALPAAATDGGGARAGTAGTAAAPTVEQDGRGDPTQLDGALATLTELLNSTVAFWARRGPDAKGGGFFTYLDRSGDPAGAALPLAAALQA